VVDVCECRTPRPTTVVDDALLLERKLLWSTRAKIDVQFALLTWGAI
jgi:hypothetical protein